MTFRLSHELIFTLQWPFNTQYILIFTSLRSIDLLDNQISQPASDKPLSIGRTLEWINLNKNSVTDTSEGQSNFIELYLSSNQITEFPDIDPDIATHFYMEKNHLITIAMQDMIPFTSLAVYDEQTLCWTTRTGRSSMVWHQHSNRYSSSCFWL